MSEDVYCDICGEKLQQHVDYTDKPVRLTLNTNYCSYDLELCKNCARRFWVLIMVEEARAELGISKRGLLRISKGDKLKCLKCGKTIELTDDTMILDNVAEYIVCPHCGIQLDTHKYHLYGEKADD